MAVNFTNSIVQEAVQANTEYNIKLLIIFSFIIYSLVLAYIDYKYLRDSIRPSFKLMQLVSRIFYLPMFIYLPTLFIQLSATEGVGFLVLIQTYTYFYIAFSAILIGALYLIERLFKDYLGWELTVEGLKIKTNKLILDKKDNDKQGKVQV